MKRFPTGFKCINRDDSTPWFTVDKVYNPVYRDAGVFIEDDGLFIDGDGGEHECAMDWKLTNLKTDDQWAIQICDHYPRTIATFVEVHAEEA